MSEDIWDFDLAVARIMVSRRIRSLNTTRMGSLLSSDIQRFISTSVTARRLLHA